ncbi:MAG: DUF2190 family protein [Candidatus Hydrogenedentes bacterium]|nr:DUF2190 family protein [Candidatus Hydrogenedentota bacterium]
MTQMVSGAKKAFTAGAAIPLHARVKLTAGKLALAGLADGGAELGVMDAEAFADGDYCAVILPNAPGTRIGIAAAAITLGALIYSAADGKLSSTAAAGSYLRGVAVQAAGANNDWFEYAPLAGGVAIDSSSVVRAGIATAGAGEATANLMDITTGLAAITGWQIQILRSGVPVILDQVLSSPSAGVLRVADGASTFQVTNGDKYNWIAYGTL